MKIDSSNIQSVIRHGRWQMDIQPAKALAAAISKSELLEDQGSSPEKEVWEPNSGGSRISKWRGQGAVGAEFECRSRKDRGAEGAEGSRVWGGGVPSPVHWGRVWRALPRKKFDFGSQIGIFWCELGAFCTVHLRLV